MPQLGVLAGIITPCYEEDDVTVVEAKPWERVVNLTEVRVELSTGGLTQFTAAKQAVKDKLDEVGHTGFGEESDIYSVRTVGGHNSGVAIECRNQFVARQVLALMRDWAPGNVPAGRIYIPGQRG